MSFGILGTLGILSILHDLGLLGVFGFRDVFNTLSVKIELTLSLAAPFAPPPLSGGPRSDWT